MFLDVLEQKHRLRLSHSVTLLWRNHFVAILANLISVVLDKIGQSLHLFVIAWVSELIRCRIDRSEENTVERRGVQLQSLLQITHSFSLLFKQGFEDGELEHVAKVQL